MLKKLSGDGERRYLTMGFPERFQKAGIYTDIYIQLVYFLAPAILGYSQTCDGGPQLLLPASDCTSARGLSKGIKP